MIEEKDPNEENLKKEARAISIREGSSYSFMDGFGLRFITPYALALGAGTTQIGVLSSVPGLLGNLSQIGTIKLMSRTTRRKIVFWSVLFQAIMWLPLILIGFFFFFYGISSVFAVSLLIVSYSILIIVGAVAGPAWNSWMKDIVPLRVGEFFGRRSRIVGIIALSSMLAAGLILHYFEKSQVFYAFAIMFFIAFVGRSLSAYFFTKQYEPKFFYKPESYFSFRQFVRKMLYNNFGRFVLFVSLVSFSTAVASPFFAVYMLGDLKFSYLYFTIVTLSSALTTLIFMPLWGKFSDKYGNVRTMKVTVIFTVGIPLIWFFSYVLGIGGIKLLFYLALTECFSGFVWAGFNLSAGNFIYDAVTRERVAICAAYFNIINAAGAFFGALLGGYLGSLSLGIFGLSSLLFVFLISGIFRFISAIGLISSVREVRGVEKFDARKLKINFGHLWHYLGFRNLRAVDGNN